MADDGGVEPIGNYDVSAYWSRVGREIEARGADNVIAGDDDAFNRYKRQKFLTRFLHSIDFDGKRVLEIGCGPGGNLVEIGRQHRPAKLRGADISPVMARIAAQNLRTNGIEAEVTHIDGRTLPFPDRSVDVAYTVTVIQHNTHGPSCAALVGEICRVTAETVVLMEDIGGADLDGTGTWVGRRVDVYAALMRQGGFALEDCTFLDIELSRKAELLSRKLRPAGHREGEPPGAAATALLAAGIPITSRLDPLVRRQAGLAKMVYRRQ